MNQEDDMLRPHVRRAARSAIMALVLISAYLFNEACHRDAVPLDPTTQAQLNSTPYELRECPHNWPDTFTVAGNRTNVPEYHDCQRFILRTSTEFVFDSLYAIFADSALETLSQRLDELDNGDEDEDEGDEEEEGRKGHRTAKRGAERNRHGNKRAPARLRGTGLVAAEIYAEGSYAPLGIKPGFNCLYVSGFHGLQAIIVVGVTQEPLRPHCPLSVNRAEQAGTVLEVRATSFPGLSLEDYPPVARWDWDPKRREQYIGIKCGAAWCEIGKKGFRSSPGFRAPANLSRAERRIRLVKGWYDDQVLAVNDGGQVTVSGIRATVFPDPALSARSEGEFQTGWRPVAHVALSSGHPMYAAKLNFGGTPNAYGGTSFSLEALNTLEICSRDCPGLPDPLPACDYEPPAPQNRWGWVRIRQAHQSPPLYMHKCVPRWPASGEVPATARWRWVANDETTWMRCDVGCCEVH